MKSLFYFHSVVLLLLVGCSNDQEGLEANRPNILFIIADDLRNDLGAYGADHVVSPNLDALASESLVFNRAYCQKAVCWPSRNSFFSGLMPASLGKKTNAFSTFRFEHPDISSLPQWFKQHGWFTRGFGKILHNGQDDPVSWSEPYFEPEPIHYAAEENLGKHPIINKSVPENRLNPLFESADVTDDAYEDGLTAKAAQKAIREAANREEPFFMMVGFHKPHTPFNAPKKYWDLYNRDSIPLAAFPNPPKNVDEKYSVHNSNYVRSFKDIPQSGQMPNELAREIRHAYYACISYVDALVGSLLDELEASGQRENTIVVFTSDHGYQLGDHSLWSKHTNFELATRVPLFVSVPGASTRGSSTDSLVELVDLFPTLAELCGLTLPDHLEGKSFRRVLFDSEAKVREEAYSEYNRNGARGCSIRTDRFRYIEWRDQKSGDVVARELYDHAHDPGENVNVAEEGEYDGEIENLSKLVATRM
ncbi:MAG: sulfatase [Verrucomicrobia bacterium]|nr:sulfatase [Verrucomicrobiota bacterium]